MFAGGRDIVCLSRSDVPVPLTLDCGPNIINVTYSNYGRTEPYSVMCPHPHGSSEDVTCTSPIWDQLDTCDGLRSCQKEVVLSGNDPCYMTGKYAEVRYICQGERSCVHDDVIKWKHFPHYWPFVRGIHRLPVDSPYTGQRRRPENASCQVLMIDYQYLFVLIPLTPHK